MAVRKYIVDKKEDAIIYVGGTVKLSHKTGGKVAGDRLWINGKLEVVKVHCPAKWPDWKVRKYCLPRL